MNKITDKTNITFAASPELTKKIYTIADEQEISVAQAARVLVSLGIEVLEDGTDEPEPVIGTSKNELRVAILDLLDKFGV